jgi:hypothetical protein
MTQRNESKPILVSRRHRYHRRRGFRPILEAYENRQLLSTVTPTTVTFDPDGTGPSTPVIVGTIDELPGNAIAVGYNVANPASPTGFSTPTVGHTFTLEYQASVGDLLDASGNPVYGYGISNGGNTGQLTVVASFTEQVTSATATTAAFTTTGAGTVTFYFNPTRAANNLTGTDFAPGTPGNTLAANTYITVYSGTIIPGASGVFSVATTPGQNAGALDQSPNGNNYPGVNTVAGTGGTNLGVQTTSLNTAFFTTAPPPSMLIQFTNTSNNLPFSEIDPSAIFFDGQSGVASVGPVNGGSNAAGNPLAANVMFQADANTSFATSLTPGPALTWGYWKTHTGYGPQANAWSTATVDLGDNVEYFGAVDAQGRAASSMKFGGHTYSFADLQTILGSSVGGNALINLGHQLIAAILNDVNGAGTPAAVSLIHQASDLLAANSLVIGVDSVTSNSNPTLYSQIILLADQLESFNASGI